MPTNNQIKLLLYNNHIMPDDELLLPLTNRAFQYNDGYFETVIIRQGKLSFWEVHEQRMQEAAKALRLQLPPLFFSPEFADKLLELATHQQALDHGRLKLKVWRSGAGIYMPETNEADWLVTINPASPMATSPMQVGVCQQIQTVFSPLSHFKGPNAPLYVLAGLEKKAFAKDDMLLLNRQEHVAEFISSNIFWIKNDSLYTPPLETGCINGVLRRSIFSWCQQRQVQLQEKLIGMNDLRQAELVFSSNVTGLRTISFIDDTPLPTQHSLLERIQKDLFN